MNYWMITKLDGPGSAPAVDSASAMSEGPPNVHKLPGRKKGQAAASQREALDEAAPDPNGGVTHLDAKWLLVPLGIVVLALLALLGLGITAWVRNPQISGRVVPSSLRPRTCTCT